MQQMQDTVETFIILNFSLKELFYFQKIKNEFAVLIHFSYISAPLEKFKKCH